PYRYRVQVSAARTGRVLHLRIDNGDPAMATEGLVRPGVTAAAPPPARDAIDAFAGRHRYRTLEALPWVAAIAAYAVFPSYLPLGAQILAMILFTLSADLVLGYAGIVTLGHAAFFGRTAYAYCLVVLFLCWYLARRVVHSPFGRSLTGIRENVRRMHAIGAPVVRRRLVIYTISAAFAGTAGALIAQTTQFVGLTFLNLERSGSALIMLIIGGVGRLYGAFIGVPLYMIAQDRFSEIEPVYWYFWIGLMMVLVVVFA